FMQGEPLEKTLAWAAAEVEGFMRTWVRAVLRSADRWDGRIAARVSGRLRLVRVPAAAISGRTAIDSSWITRSRSTGPGAGRSSSSGEPYALEHGRRDGGSAFDRRRRPPALLAWHRDAAQIDHRIFDDASAHPAGPASRPLPGPLHQPPRRAQQV